MEDEPHDSQRDDPPPQPQPPPAAWAPASEPIEPLPDPPPARSTRARQLALVVAAVAVGVALILTTSSPNRAAPRRPSGAQVAQAQSAIDSLLAGIPQSANVLGRASAPVTLQWWGDLECPFCREFSFGALPEIIKRWVRGGQLKIDYRALQTATRDTKVFDRQEIAALAAGAQHRMWNYIETFYYEQGEEGSGYVTEAYLRGLARQVPGLNATLWGEERFDPRLAAQLARERAQARHGGYTSTPTFLIGRSGHRLLQFKTRSLLNASVFDRLVELVLGLKSRTAVPAAYAGSLAAAQIRRV